MAGAYRYTQKPTRNPRAAKRTFAIRECRFARLAEATAALGETRARRPKRAPSLAPCALSLSP